MNLKIKRMYLQLFSILCFFVFVIMAGIRISSAENIESVQNGVNIFTDYNLQNSDTENFRNFYITEDQRGYSSYKYKADKTDVNFDSGWLYRLEAGKTEETIMLMDSNSGEFNIIAQPVMTQLYKASGYEDEEWVGQYRNKIPDYKIIEFTFRDLYSENYITVSLIANKNGQGYTDVVIYYYDDGERKESSLNGNSLINTSFYGVADFVWDLEGNLSLRKVPLIMEYDPANPSKIYFAHNRQSVVSEMTVTDGEYLPAFDYYSVELSFSERNPESEANIMIYELCSQRLDGDTDTFRDTAVPSLSAKTDLYAVKGFSYTLPKIYAFDVTDGDLTESVELKITSPSGENCEASDGKFEVNESGIYRLHYSVKDKSGKEKESTVEVFAYESKPRPEIIKEFELEREYAKNSTVSLPDAQIKTHLKKQDDVSDYYILIQKNYEVVKWFDGAEPKKEFVLNEIGRYDVIYVAVDEIGLTFSSINSFDCVEDAYFADITVPQYIHCGQIFELPQMSLITEDGKVPSSVIRVEGPNGTADGEIAQYNPKKIGTYRFTYQAKYNGKIYEKTVSVEAGAVNEALFVNESGCSVIEGNTELPAWSKKGNGVKILGKDTYSSFAFLNLIDLNDLTKEDILLQYQVLSGDGYTSFDTIEVELIDENDANNVVKIKMVAAENDLLYRYSYMTVNYDGRYMGLHGREQNRLAYGTEYGTLFYGSFQGSKLSNYPMFTIRMDYAEKTIYADDVWTIGSGPKKVLDMSDEEIVGQARAWQGVSTGRVYMRVTMSSITGQGGVVVTNIAGKSLAGNMLQAQEPSIYFEENKAVDFNSMPLAEKNTKYPIPSAQAYDFAYGVVDLSVNICRVGSDESVVIDMANPYYIFNDTGSYLIRYTATNWSNKQSMLELSVLVQEKLADIEVDFEYAPETAIAGREYELPKLIAFGGAGILQLDYTVFLNEETLELPENRIVSIDSIGEIIYRYDVVDYLGKTKSGTLKIEVELPVSGNEVIELEEMMPLSVRKGETLIFPEFKVKSLDSDGSQSGTADPWIEINGVRIDSTKEYVVTENIGTILEVAFCVGQTKKVYQVAVIEGVYLKDYLIETAGQAEIVSTILSMNVTFGKVPTEIMLANRVSQNNLVLKFGVSEKENGMEAVTFILRDGMDSEKYVTLTFEPKDNDTSYLRINHSQKRYIIDGSFSNEAKLFLLTFNGDTGVLSTTKTILRANGGEIKNECEFIIDQYANGNRYEGFYRGGVEVSVSSQATGDGKATINLTQISNQPLLGGAITTGELKIYRDTISPVFYYFGAVPSGSYSVNSEIEFPAATAYDALGGNLDVTLSLKGVDGELIFDKVPIEQAKTYTVERYGRYILNYYVTDKTGTIYTDQYPIFIKDEIAPVLEVNGVYESEYIRNSVIDVYDANAQDNYSDVDIYVLLSDPDADTHVVEQGSCVTLDKNGLYYLTYRAMDKQGNYTTKVFRFMVTEAKQ